MLNEQQAVQCVDNVITLSKINRSSACQNAIQNSGRAANSERKFSQ